MLNMEILVKMLANAAVELKANDKHLCELDGVTGDGDHGITIGRMADMMKKHLEAPTSTDLNGLLDDLGMLFMGSNGGSAGPLWGTIFSGLASGVEPGKTEVDLEGFRAMLRSAQSEFQDISKAKVGDKTLVDALYPAIDAAHNTEGGLAEVMEAMAGAAEQGADATVNMAAKFGRAKNMGENSKGTKDPGATSMAILLRSMAQALA